MENKYKKSTESSPSAATTSSEMNNSFNFMNLTSLESLDASIQVEAPTSHSLRSEQLKESAVKSIAHDYQMNKTVPTKILPNSLYQVSEKPPDKVVDTQREKTLVEIGFKANEIEEWESIKQPPKENLYKLLKNMIDNYIKPNVQVRVGDVSFNCHMMVLQCYSDFFMEFSNEAIVQLPKERITPQAFMMVYDWMLSAEPQVQREGILELFNAANFLKIKGLVDQCWVCLDDDIRFKEDTAFLLYLEARNYGLEMLQQLMLTRICRFFLTLVSSKDFVLLSAKEVCTLLSSNSIGVNSEVEVLMSAVRWLSYNWSERQSQMLEVLGCVRFGLVAPWILVALRRDNVCIGVERVVDNPQVKKMIDDGLSYTTTQLFYSNNVDHFLAFLERYQLTKPVQRQWICDQECNYHHKVNCPNRQYITYESFLEYLEMTRSRGKDHWKTLKMDNQEGLNFQCCLPEANAHNDQYFYYVLPKESRDQGVQVSGEMSDDDGTEYNTRTRTRTTSQAVDIKASWYQEICSSNKTNARGNFGTALNKNNNNNDNIATIATKEDNKNITLSQKSSSCCDVNQKAINIKKSILAKSYYCNMSSQNFQTTAVPRGSVDEIRGREMSPVEEKGSNYSSAIKGSDTKQISISRKLDDTCSESNLSITNQKIFIFGGIDPYAPRQPNHGMDVLYYDGCENTWKYLSNMPGSRHHHSAVVFRGKIYVIGGTRPALAGSIKSIFETAVWSFDPNRQEWYNECTLPQPRRDFGLIAYDNDATNNNGSGDAGQGDRGWHTRTGLYIIGGESIDGTMLSSTLYYNVERKLWSEKASLNIGRYGLVATVVNTKNTAEIWIAGGVCGQKQDGIPVITDTMEYYNLASDGGSWKQSVKRLRMPRLFARFCSTGGGTDLYIIGGIGLDAQHPGEFLSLSSVDRYDFQEGQWIHLTDMTTARHGHDVVSLKDKILIFGGVSAAAKKTLKSVECLSSKTDSWLSNIACLPSALSGLAAVVIDCDI